MLDKVSVRTSGYLHPSGDASAARADAPPRDTYAGSVQSPWSAKVSVVRGQFAAVPPTAPEEASEPKASAVMKGASRVALLAGLAGIMTVMGCWATPVQAYEAPHHGSISTTRTLREGGELKKALTAAVESPDHQALMRTIPSEVMKAYSHLSPAEKHEMAQRLQGTSGFLFITVENRQAFIDGTAHGVDVFEKLKGELQDQLQDGKLPQSEFHHRMTALMALKSLTPEQRGAMVVHLEKEVALLPH